MISQKKLEGQLKKINFYHKGWGRSEVNELTNILMPEEEIEECVNGYYEAGFALLVATKDRLLLVDKKPLGYLTIEDLRFDMINEFDLHHRLLGAQIKISAGNKTLHFTSLNQPRLRRLLNYVQARMTQTKKDKEGHLTEQKKHLEEMNEQLRLYLMAAHKQQYIDQANAIQRAPQQDTPLNYPHPQSQAPAFSFYGPTVQRSQPSAAPTPFEQVAAQVFDAQAQYPERHAMTHSGAGTVESIVNASQQALREVGQIALTHQQIGLAAARRVLPVISAYTRLPVLSQRRRFKAPRPDIA